MAYWFKRRRYGYGWVPVAPAGWLVLSLFLAIIGGVSYRYAARPEPPTSHDTGRFLGIIVLATVALVGVCRTTGPKPKWRWGKRETDNPSEDF